MNGKDAVDGWASRIRALHDALLFPELKSAVFVLLSESPARIQGDIVEYVAGAGYTAHTDVVVGAVHHLLQMAQGAFNAGNMGSCRTCLDVAEGIVGHQLRKKLQNHDNVN
jgi:hypothetical protein